LSAHGHGLRQNFEHGADIGVRGFGPTWTRAFGQAALALVGVITDPSGVAPKESVDLACEAPDDELLLVAWLNAVVTEMAARRMSLGRFDLRIEGHRLAGADRGRHPNRPGRTCDGPHRLDAIAQRRPGARAPVRGARLRARAPPPAAGVARDRPAGADARRHAARPRRRPAPTST
jgi:SHS2 domain-containing protein